MERCISAVPGPSLGTDADEGGGAETVLLGGDWAVTLDVVVLVVVGGAEGMPRAGGSRGWGAC